LYATNRIDLLFNFDINSENNFFLGSGQLDGAGVPADFFSDLNVRRGFSHCLDTALYSEQALYGESIANNGVIPPPLLGYNPEQETPAFDPELCAQELSLAWEGQLPAVGFRLQVPFVSEDRAQELALAILQANLHAVNSAYRLETVGLPRTLYAESRENGRLPLLFHSWTQTLPDPHNWTTAYYTDPVAGYQRLPADLEVQIAELVSGGAAATGPAGRERIYHDLDRVRFSNLPNIILPQPAGVVYHQRWLTAWFHHPLLPAPYYYAFEISP
jgi:peptide/nickel transport system substrate-binding protein